MEGNICRIEVMKQYTKLIQKKQKIQATTFAIAKL